VTVTVIVGIGVQDAAALNNAQQRIGAHFSEGHDERSSFKVFLDMDLFVAASNGRSTVRRQATVVPAPSYVPAVASSRFPASNQALNLAGTPAKRRGSAERECEHRSRTVRTPGGEAHGHRRSIALQFRKLAGPC
jgi:hypothetical protein